jgi:hypothetical protein
MKTAKQVLVLGGDRIDPIRGMLAERNVEVADHWPNGSNARAVGTTIDFVLVITDFIGHKSINAMRKQCGERIPMVYTKRSIIAATRAVDQFLGRHAAE